VPGPAPDFASAYTVVWTCVIGPGTLDDYAGVVRLAERMMEETGGIRRRHIHALSFLGASLYRAGRYREAIDRLNEAAAVRGEGAPRDGAFLALAQHRLGNAAEARKLLDMVPAYAPTEGTFDWELLEIEVLRREAAAAIRP
jgi:hypothetical protein